MNSSEQIFKTVFGSAWQTIPPVFQKRYINRPFCHDISTVEGAMDISYSKTMSWMMPIFRLIHILAPYRGKNVPVTVDIRSQIDSDTVSLNRKFYFPDKKPYEFNARMQVVKMNDVIEHMSFGLSWRNHCFYDGKKVVMQHKGYVWRIFGLNIPLPLEFILGSGHAEEEALDDNSYKLTMTLSHPLFGVTYSCSGNLSFKKLPI